MAELKNTTQSTLFKEPSNPDVASGKGYDPVVVEYLKQPLNEAEIRELFAKLGLDDVKSMMRVKEAEYKEAGLQQADTSDDERFAAMAAHPKLIERPVVINGDKAKIGRPPESVLDIL